MIEGQVATLSQSLALTRIGIKVDSLFYYLHDKHNCCHNGIIQDNHPGLHRFSDTHELLPALTCSELGQILKNFLHQTSFFDGQWECQLLIIESRSYFYKTFFGETEANARADGLIWLLENKYLTPSTVYL